MSTNIQTQPQTVRRAYIDTVDDTDLDRIKDRPILHPNDAQLAAFDAGETNYAFLMGLRDSSPVATTPTQVASSEVTTKTTPVSPVVTSTPTKDPNVYALAMPRACAYGWLAEQAAILGGPFAWAYASLLTLSSPRVTIRSDYSEAVRPTLYTALLGGKGVGKSRTVSRAIDALGNIKGDIEETVPGSDQGLIKMFDAPEGQDLWPRVLVQDELRNMFAKIGIQGSSLGSVLCTLFYQDEVGSAVKGKKVTASVRLSILGSIKCKDQTEFREVFGAETLAGLYSRFLLIPGPAKWDWDDAWIKRQPSSEIGDDFAIEDDGPRQGSVVTIKKCALDRVKAWRAEQPDKDRGRPGELALRIAAISASMNKESVISPECMDAALALMTWQEAVTLIYAPSEGRNPDAIVTGEVLAAFDEAHKAAPNAWQVFRDLSRKHQWPNKHGSMVTRIRESLVKDGILEEEGAEDENGYWRKARYPRYRLQA